MSCYVDMLIDYGWRLGPSCHLLADTEEELHEMAAKIGMKRSWFQVGGKAEMPHYDLVASRRKRAVALGAIEINRKQLCEKLAQWRQSIT
ncbi:MAG: DUF4031 domain-containing protein [Chitinophagaceae bacterium]|nr:MAG: DUF4031 domain-containing protein [Chitinophagaceae bacterium]